MKERFAFVVLSTKVNELLYTGILYNNNMLFELHDDVLML